jgi:glycosyltransferase involved in cell wall biosynthesis
MSVAPPRVSWLIPVRNGIPYLPLTLASIAVQTYRNFEVLVWDNGSTDGTVEELHRWIPHRLPGRVISGQPLGLSASRAALVELSQAEFCALIDADDLAVPERLQMEVDFLSAHPEISLVGGQAQFIDEKGDRIDQVAFYPLDHHDIVPGLILGTPIWQPSVMFRRLDVLETGNYRQIPEELWGSKGTLNGLEDSDLWQRLAVRHRLANLPVTLLHYRIHSRSITQKGIHGETIQSRLRQVFVENAGDLYGMDRETARKFRAREIHFMLPVALRFARHRAACSEVTFWQALRNTHALDAFLSRCKFYDVVSLTAFVLLNPNPLAFILRLLRKIARRIQERRAERRAAPKREALAQE